MPENDHRDTGRLDLGSPLITVGFVLGVVIGLALLATGHHDVGLVVSLAACGGRAVVEIFRAQGTDRDDP